MTSAAPRRGILARALGDRRLRRRIDDQKTLLAFRTPRVLEGAAGLKFDALVNQVSFSTRRLRRALRRGEREGLLVGEGAIWKLTEDGHHRVASLARAQRLWRAFLVTYPDLASTFADLDMERIDDVLPAEIVAEMEKA